MPCDELLLMRRPNSENVMPITRSPIPKRPYIVLERADAVRKPFEQVGVEAVRRIAATSLVPRAYRNRSYHPIDASGPRPPCISWATIFNGTGEARRARLAGDYGVLRLQPGRPRPGSHAVEVRLSLDGPHEVELRNPAVRGDRVGEQGYR